MDRFTSPGGCTCPDTDHEDRQPLGLRFEIFQKFFLAEEMDTSFNLNTNIEVPTPHESTPRKLECRSDISKADLKIAYPNSYRDIELRAKCRKS